MGLEREWTEESQAWVHIARQECVALCKVSSGKTRILTDLFSPSDKDGNRESPHYLTRLTEIGTHYFVSGIVSSTEKIPCLRMSRNDSALMELTLS